MSAVKPIHLVFLAGCGRSGSTLFGRLLGEIEGWIYLGEALRFLFHDRMRKRLPLCACGEAVEACPFWREHDACIDPALRSRATKALRLRGQLTAPFLGRLRSVGDPVMADAMEAMLRRVQRASGVRVLVDGSKNPANGLVLAGRPGVILHVLHLVRHPGGVVNSWSKPKGYLQGHGTVRILGWWWATNVHAELLGRRAASYHRVRYEDAVADPAAVLERLVRAVEQPVGPAEGLSFPFLKGCTATIGRQHILAGNPDKLRTGPTVIQDPGWRLEGHRRFLVPALAWPLMRRYGFTVRRPQSTGT